ncbi:cupin domain-containing protein [Dyadobacter psychrotolerans]|uniref:Cupin domain-containing protein n=1 Tax=Dyadobacter psychrotolerans TaxID=2541721 RepID=A0A4R5DY42_9BACT|nr:cupin domain-containing protein [Dyadobacter psychrotolerans]TDE17111.1 cupin domain-containing protein [Dyadobacter psychrotolerans]
MKRDKFLKMSVVLPFMGGFSDVERPKKGFGVNSGKDRFDKSISLLEGDTFYTKVSSKDTNGDLYVFESTRVKIGGPSLHVHAEQDEWWYILEGEFKIKIGEDLFEVKAGDSVFGPRGVPHTFSKVGEGTARMIITFQPAGKMEQFFTSISEGVMKGKSEKEQDAFRIAHGFERVGPALDYFKKF